MDSLDYRVFPAAATIMHKEPPDSTRWRRQAKPSFVQKTSLPALTVHLHSINFSEAPCPQRSPRHSGKSVNKQWERNA